ncbi:hypothetical protein IKN40_06615 [bacterium]|nr:hypothetical protein [bacterium]
MNAYFITINSDNSDKYKVLYECNFRVFGKRLYAITSDKEYYKKFMHDRCNNLFEYHKVTFDNSDEYNNYISNNKLHSYELAYNSMNTVVDNDGINKVISIDVLSTAIEYDEVEYNLIDIIVDNLEDIVTDICMYVKHNNPKYYEYLTNNMDTGDMVLEVFTKNVREALKYLDLYQNLKIAESMIESESWYTFNIDQVALYCKLFQNTYKGNVI